MTQPSPPLAEAGDVAPTRWDGSVRGRPAVAAKSRMRRWISGVVIRLVVLAVLAWMTFPVLWILRASLLPGHASLVLPPQLLFEPTFENYWDTLTQSSFPRYFLNSLIVGGGSTALALLLGFPAAFALTRYRFPGRDSLGLYILSTRAALPVIGLIAFYVEFSRLGLLDTQLGLAIAYLSFNLPFAIWLLSGFIEQSPKDLEEAAMVDGTSQLGAMWHVTLPLVASGTAVTAMLCLLFSINEFLFAAVLTSDQAKTATVAVYGFLGQDSLDWGSMTATSLLVAIPVLVFALAVRRNLVTGLSFGALNQ